MKDLLTDKFDWFEKRLDQTDTIEKSGRILNVNGLVIESEGPEVALGEVCRIESPRSGESAPAEVVGFKENRVLLMPLGDMNDLHPGCRVVSSQEDNDVPVGESLLGRVLDGRMQPIDGLGRLTAPTTGKLKGTPPNPMTIISTAFETGVKAIDTFVPLGHGQRVVFFLVVESVNPCC